MIRALRFDARRTAICNPTRNRAEIYMTSL
jgi:hypothetical protein